MKLRVQYTAQLRTAVGRTEDEVELPEGSSLAALVEHLAAQLDDAAAGHLVGPGGGIRPSLLVVVNEAAAPAHAVATTSLQDGDVVLLLPPIAGG
ncbi:MAG: MoaD/ThiS family protein [Planctomycetaceae bacterium]|nr:MoaD/ThiS family protein [Planctomycetaceae bacterium]